jgi:peptidoglycan/LPS O-acetylase OafA/YrhL
MTKTTRNTQLDCLRGVAILLVIGVHFHAAPPAGAVGWFAEMWKRVGPVGVDLFFVLSGFLIGSLLLTELDKHGELHVGRFLIRRGFKLYPIYYTFMLYCLLFPALKSFRGGNGGAWATLTTNWRELWPSFVFAQNYGLPNPEGHTWSLAVEEHFYFVLPFVILLLGPRRTWKWLIPFCLSFVPICLGFRIFAALAHPTSENLRSLLWRTHLHVDALLLGVALAVTALRYPERFLRIGRRPVALIVLGLFLWLIALVPQWPIALWGTLGFTFRIFGSAAILLGACNLKIAEPGKVQRLLAWVGVNSYAVYVWHVSAIGITERLGGKVLGPIHNESVRWVLLTIAIIPACVIAGVIGTKLIERPSLKLRDRLFPSRGRAVVIPAKPAAPSAPPQHVPSTPVSV